MAAPQRTQTVQDALRLRGRNSSTRILPRRVLVRYKTLVLYPMRQWPADDQVTTVWLTTNRRLHRL